MAWSLERGIKVITGGTASSMDRIIDNWYLFQDAVEAARVSWPQEFSHQPWRVRLGQRSRRQVHASPCHLAYAHGPGPSSNSLPVNAGRATTELTAQVAQQDDPDFYKDWFFGTPEIVAGENLPHDQYAVASVI